MKFIKKAPLFFLIISTGILFTLIAVAGKANVYKEQAYDAKKAPLLAIMFTGINDGIYPWQVLQNTGDTSADRISGDVMVEEEMPPETEVVVAKASPTPESTPTPLPTASPTPSMEPEKWERPTPMRESTREEYLNHISGDIYGDIGVVRAATYEFLQVEESYFDDALFIGDSRTVGLRDYTDLSEHADFLCETSLTIHKVMKERFKGMGTVEEVLENGDYGKIYLMVGINELGTGTTEDYMAKYTEVIDTLHELEPEAIIYIQGVMHVTGERSKKDEIFNNQNIIARNHAIATLADNEQFFYIDVNEAVCDEEGNLNGEYTYDQIHLLGKYNELWKQFLMAHGVSITK